MLENRPMFLPDGRKSNRRGSAEAIEKALENRPDVEELKSKNILQDHETEKVEDKARARRQSISLISDVIAKEVRGPRSRDIDVCTTI